MCSPDLLGIASAGRSTGRGIESAGKQIGHGIDGAGRAVSEAVDGAGHAIGTGLTEGGHAIGGGMKDGADAIAAAFVVGSPRFGVDGATAMATATTDLAHGLAKLGNSLVEASDRFSRATVLLGAAILGAVCVCCIDKSVFIVAACNLSPWLWIIMSKRAEQPTNAVFIFAFVSLPSLVVRVIFWANHPDDLDLPLFAAKRFLVLVFHNFFAAAILLAVAYGLSVHVQRFALFLALELFAVAIHMAGAWELMRAVGDTSSSSDDWLWNCFGLVVWMAVPLLFAV
ncbi:hypothetical protein HDU82_002263 [Entophlyctis luteolus]|nr:hypothetical protein HDU82_002263 [Entophlyctis luteolus]